MVTGRRRHSATESFDAPVNFFTPRRFPAESLPFLDEPPPLFVAVRIWSWRATKESGFSDNELFSVDARKRLGKSNSLEGPAKRSCRIEEKMLEARAWGRGMTDPPSMPSRTKELDGMVGKRMEGSENEDRCTVDAKPFRPEKSRVHHRAPCRRLHRPTVTPPIAYRIQTDRYAHILCLYHIPARQTRPAPSPRRAMDDELHHLDTELRAIQLYANEAPRLQPIRLGIDKMFLRAHQWASTSAPAPIARPPSPPRRAAIFPLPKPMEGDAQTSPLGGLFEFPELIPHVLEWFEHPRDLAVLCRVSKGFNGVARKKLYQNIWVRPCEWTDQWTEVSSRSVDGTECS